MIELFIVFFAVCIVSLSAWFYWINREQNAPPLFKNCIPFLGHVHLLKGGGNSSAVFWETIVGLIRSGIGNGGVFRSYMGCQTYYILTDPEDSLTVGNACDQKHYVYNFGKPWLGNGLFTASGPTFRRHKKLISPAFNMQVQLGFMDIFNSQSRKVIKKLDTKVSQGPVDLIEIFRALAFETVFLAAFGISPESDTNFYEVYGDAAAKFMNIFIMRFQYIPYHLNFIYQFTKLKKEEDELLANITELASKVIKKKREELQNGDLKPIEYTSGLKKMPLLDHMLELSESEGDKRLTDNEIREEIDTVITAALDTTALTITYVLNFLGTHPDKQEKAYNEIMEVMGDSDRDVDRYDIPKLVYLEAVIKEALRLYPTGPFTLRTLDKDVKLKKYTLRAGGHCIISSYGMHRSACWGPDAEEFRPERWLEPDVPTSAFTGFGVGKRSCPGRNYAMLFVKTSLVHLLRRYKVDANIKDIKFKIDILLKPISGHFVTVEYRNKI